MPVDFGKENWKKYSRMYAALSIYYGDDQFVDKVFDMIHKDKRKDLGINDLAKALNINDEESSSLSDIYYSDEVGQMVYDYSEFSKNVRVMGVPSLLVGGNHYTDAAMTRGVDGLIPVLNFF